MSVGTRINSTLGVNTTNGDQGLVVERDTNNVGFSPFKVESVKAITTSSTLVPGDAGVCTISGNVIHTVVMPVASASAGTFWMFRMTSGHAHVLTASQESQGTKPFSYISSAPGSKLTISGAANQNVILLCDGYNFTVVGATSGSAAFTISGT
jgi:hypothetical protein